MTTRHRRKLHQENLLSWCLFRERRPYHYNPLPASIIDHLLTNHEEKDDEHDNYLFLWSNYMLAKVREEVRNDNYEMVLDLLMKGFKMTWFNGKEQVKMLKAKHFSLQCGILQAMQNILWSLSRKQNGGKLITYAREECYMIIAVSLHGAEEICFPFTEQGPSIMHTLLETCFESSAIRSDANTRLNKLFAMDLRKNWRDIFYKCTLNENEMNFTKYYFGLSQPEVLLAPGVFHQLISIPYLLQFIMSDFVGLMIEIIHVLLSMSTPKSHKKKIDWKLSCRFKEKIQIITNIWNHCDMCQCYQCKPISFKLHRAGLANVMKLFFGMLRDLQIDRLPQIFGMIGVNVFELLKRQIYDLCPRVFWYALYTQQEIWRMKEDCKTTSQMEDLNAADFLFREDQSSGQLIKDHQLGCPDGKKCPLNKYFYQWDGVITTFLRLNLLTIGYPIKGLDALRSVAQRIADVVTFRCPDKELAIQNNVLNFSLIGMYPEEIRSVEFN